MNDAYARQPVLGEAPPAGLAEKAELALLLARQDGLCAGACGRALVLGVDDVELEHAIPRSVRPDLADVPSNRQAMCQPCNGAKSDRSMRQMAALWKGGWRAALERHLRHAPASEGLAEQPFGPYEYCGAAVEANFLCGQRVSVDPEVLPLLCERCYRRWRTRCRSCGRHIARRGEGGARRAARECERCRRIGRAIVYRRNFA